MNRTIVHVDGLVMFTHADVLVTLAGCAAAADDPGRLIRAILAAHRYRRNELFNESMSGGGGVLSELGHIDLDQFVLILRDEELLEKARRGAQIAKIDATAERRREFNRNRADLILKMLDAGVPYLCAADECEITFSLTVDHKTALSRGGTDDLDNLQFLCRNHNSQKADK